MAICKALLSTIAMLCASAALTACTSANSVPEPPSPASGSITVAASEEAASSPEPRPETLEEYLQMVGPLLSQLDVCVQNSIDSAKERRLFDVHDQYSEAQRLYQNIAGIEPPEPAKVVHEEHKEYAEAMRAATQYYFKAVDEAQEGTLDKANEYLRIASGYVKKAAEWHEKADATIRDAQSESSE